jgi:hypothetical protein
MRELTDALLDRRLADFRASVTRMNEQLQRLSAL